MKCPLALVPFLATALQGQISNLAVNADGSELQFASQYGLKGEGDPALASRIYRYAPGQPELITRAADASALQPVAPYISDDGQTRGWFTFLPCIGRCMFTVPGGGGVTLVRNGKPFQSYGQTPRLSRNGRWLFYSGFPNFNSRLVDIDTGATTVLPGFIQLHPTHAVADDGTLVTSTLDNPNAIRVTENGAKTPIEIPFPGRILSAAITPDGRKLFAITQETLYEIDRESLTRRELYAASEPLVRFSPSAQGDRILLQSGTQVLLIDASTTRTLYTANEPIAGVILSAGGQTAFVITTANRLLRIKDGETQELYPSFTSLARQTTFGAFPGSLVRLSGGPFADNQSLTVQGRAFPVVAINQRNYEAQIPWDFDINAGDAFTLSAPDSPFVLNDRLHFNAEPIPAIYTEYYPENSRFEAKAAQADFSSLVTRDNPAPAGSTIHIWLTGLGPLDRPLATGERGPVNDPARPLTPIACFIRNDTDNPAFRGLQLPFVAYAPGLLGVYQVDIVIPADWTAGSATLSCRLSDGYLGSIATTYIAP